METKGLNETNGGKQLGEPACGHTSWMRTLNERRARLQAFSVETTQIHSIPASILQVHAHRVPVHVHAMSCWHVYMSSFIICLLLYFQILPITMALTQCCNPSHCAEHVTGSTKESTWTTPAETGSLQSPYTACGPSCIHCSNADQKQFCEDNFNI